MHLSDRHPTLGTMTTPPSSAPASPAEGVLVTHTQRMAEALALEFSTSVGARNPAWDIDQPDGPDNRYYFSRSLAERVVGSPMIHFTATDGHRSMRVPTFHELAEALVKRGAVVESSTFTDDALVEKVIDTAFADVHAQQRASVRRDVRTILSALVEVLTEDRCHCGRAVVGASEDNPAGRVLCAECADLRCDAYPGACTASQDSSTR